MLVPIVCFERGRPIEHLSKPYYDAIDEETKKRQKFLETKEVDELIEKLLIARGVEDNQELTDLEKAVQNLRNEEFKDMFIQLYEQGKLSELKGAVAQQLYNIYKDTPEFLALEKIGLGPRNYCCRKAFLCHPRNLFEIVH